MKTTSEREFERFLTENGLPFERVEEQPTRRPDYLVQIGDAKVFFEVKEISEDENFAAPTYRRTLGDHIRAKIGEARGQVQYGADQGIPSVLVIYNNLDPFHLFGTEDQDFISAMYGAYTVVFDPERMKIVDHFHGRNKSLDENKNTSFSAVGRLYPVRTRLGVTLFENAFAKVKLRFDSLPACFDVKRVRIEYVEHL
ncbi:MAG: hypothetical protein LAP86_29055 [Acidobacteriia bacterium]|nr:hypothetical protein [Terriglobia bacterium]